MLKFPEKISHRKMTENQNGIGFLQQHCKCEDNRAMSSKS